MYHNKPIKQLSSIQTNVTNPTNTPMIPNQFQTGSYYGSTQMVQQPPMQPEMGDQMGTYPIQKKNCKY